MEPWVLSVLCVAIFIVVMLLGVPVVYSLGIAAVVAGLIGYGPSVLPKVGWAPFSMLFNLAWTPLLLLCNGFFNCRNHHGEDLSTASKCYPVSPEGSSPPASWAKPLCQQHWNQCRHHHCHG
jgi:hypothetical protein